MSEVKINLNADIKVQLTDWGKEIFFHKNDDINEMFGWAPIPANVDKEGYTRFSLWEFMELYGQYIGMGKCDVIQPIYIILDSSDVKPVICKERVYDE